MKLLTCFIILLMLALMWALHSRGEEYIVIHPKSAPVVHEWHFNAKEVMKALTEYLERKGIKVPEGEADIFGLDIKALNTKLGPGIILTIREGGE